MWCKSLNGMQLDGMKRSSLSWNATQCHARQCEKAYNCVQYIVYNVLYVIVACIYIYTHNNIYNIINV